MALSEFSEQAKSQKRPVESGRVVEGLGGMMKNWRNDALGKCIRVILGAYMTKTKKLDMIVTLHGITKGFMLANELICWPRWMRRSLQCSLGN